MKKLLMVLAVMALCGVTANAKHWTLEGRERAREENLNKCEFRDKTDERERNSARFKREHPTLSPLSKVANFILFPFITADVTGEAITRPTSLSFANSSGTSGCGKKETAYIEQQHFVAVTIANLSQQIAAGGGEHLQSLSTLLGCPKSDYSDLVLMARQNYEQLFPSVEPEPEVFLAQLKEIIRDDPRLAGGCVYI